MRKKRPTDKDVWICIDPGVANTGIAVLSPGPPLRLLETKVLRSSKDLGWVDRCYQIVRLFNQNFLYPLTYMAPGTLGAVGHPRTVTIYVEMPNVWGGSGRGYAAAASGDIVHLSALVGMIALQCRKSCAMFVEVGVGEWKGSLPKEVVVKRVKRAFGLTKIPNHAADAAGIGLWAAKGRV